MVQATGREKSYEIEQPQGADTRIDIIKAMTKRQIIILSALGAFVLLLVVWGLAGGGPMGPNGSSPEDTGGAVGGNEDAPSNAPPPTYTSEVPLDATPTAPVVEAPAAPGRDERLGIFDMTVSAAGYNPSALTVKLGDLVQIRLTAAGGDYDFSMPWSGLYQSVKKGETKQISFQTTAVGTYLFQCRDFCPSGKTINGQVIVLP